MTGLRVSYKPRRNGREKSEREKKRLNPSPHVDPKGGTNRFFCPPEGLLGPSNYTLKGETEAKQEKKVRFESPATPTPRGGTNILWTSFVRRSALYSEGVTIL